MSHLGTANFIIKIISVDTCLIHGVSESDEKTNKRWFAYFGQDIKNFQQSYDFAYRYSGGHRPMEFWRIRKPLQLLYIPYLVLLENTDEEEDIAQTTAWHLIQLIVQNYNVLQVVKTYGQHECIRQVMDGILGRTIEEDTLIPELKPYYDLPDTNGQNPDYILSKVLCELGFNGWVRLGNQKTYTSGDEIFVCNIRDMQKGGYMEPCGKCDEYGVFSAS